MKKLTVAIIGLEHIHSGCMYNAFSEYPDRFRFIGCADVPPIADDVVEAAETRMQRNMRRAVQDGLTLYDDYHALMEQRPDIAVVCSNMRSYPRIVEELLAADLNVVVEKPMAMTFEDGMRMYRAAEHAKGFLAVNWPVAWFDAFAKAKAVADSGKIGEVLRVHYRSPATLGPYTPTLTGITDAEKERFLKMFWYHHSMGGGSSLDYGGYGCTLATWIFGRQAERVCGIRKNFFIGFSDVEDYVNYTLDFGRGVADVEGSWSTFNNGEIPTGPVIYGSQGVIVADRYGSEVKVYTQFSHASVPPQEVISCTPWNAPDCTLPLNLYDRIVNGALLREMITPAFNIKALAALDAGIRSSYSGKWEDTKRAEDFV